MVRYNLAILYFGPAVAAQCYSFFSHESLYPALSCTFGQGDFFVQGLWATTTEKTCIFLRKQSLFAKTIDISRVTADYLSAKFECNYGGSPVWCGITKRNRSPCHHSGDTHRERQDAAGE